MCTTVTLGMRVPAAPFLAQHTQAHTSRKPRWPAPQLVRAHAHTYAHHVAHRGRSTMLIDRGEHACALGAPPASTRAMRAVRACVRSTHGPPAAALQAAAAAEVAQLKSAAPCDERRHHVMHGDGGWTAPTAVPLRGRLKVLFANAFEFEVEQGTVGMLGTSSTRSARRRCRA